MIFCNECGNQINEGLRFCTECGTEALRGTRTEPLQPTMQVNANPYVVAPVQTPAMPYQQVRPMAQPGALDNLGGGAPAHTPAQPARSKAPLVIFGMMAILAVAFIVYFAVGSRSNSNATETPASLSTNSNVSTDTSTVNDNAPISNPASSEDSVATSLNDAIDGGRLVTPGGDDAYAYYTQLRTMNPQHPALSNVKSKVLPKLRSTGEEIIDRRINHSGEVNEPDWTLSLRAYGWAHVLEPNDDALEARHKYVQGKLAEVQERRGEAWQDFSDATRLDPSWAVPLNDLGFLTTQDKNAGKQKWSSAISYYQRAIRLQPDWDIPYNNMGTAYYYLESYDTAEGYYREAIQRNSNWARPHKWLGDVYVKKNMNSAALTEYQTAVNLYNPKTDSLDIGSIQTKITQLRASGY